MTVEGNNDIQFNNIDSLGKTWSPGTSIKIHTEKTSVAKRPLRKDLRLPNFNCFKVCVFMCVGVYFTVYAHMCL